MTCVICGIPIQRTWTEGGFNLTAKRDWPQDCRAVYVFDWDLNNIKISGLGIRAENDDIFVPVDPSKRHNGGINQERIEVRELGEGFPFPRDNRHWGFVLHDACWGLLCEGFQVDLNHLFLFYLSTYLGPCGLPCWSGDYGGVARMDTDGEVIFWGPTYDHDVDEDVPAELKTNPFQIPALRKAITYSAQAQLGQRHFSHLPTEIAETILTHLPSPDVHSLRLASPVFATLTLSERFWASRFRKGREFEFIPDVLNNPPTSWRALYLSLHVWASDNLGMRNRRRVWKLVDRIQSVLCHIRDTTCFGTVSKSLIDPEAPDNYVQVAEGYSWLTAERTARKSNFRNLRYRTLSFPGPIQITQVSVSMFDTPDGPYVSGLTFIDHDGQVAHFGYCHPRNIVHIELPGAQHIQGWEVAHDLLGVKAIAVVAQDGTVSRFAGNPNGHPRKLLVTSEGVSSMRATFDGVKMVALGQTTRDAITHRTGYLWASQVPAKEYFLNSACGTFLPTDLNHVARNVFFKRPGDNRRLMSILCDNIDVCHVAQMEFKFVDERSVQVWQKLGNVAPLVTRPFETKFGDNEVQGYSIDLNSRNGEEITGLDVQMCEGLVCGLKVHTNLGRSKSLTSKASPILGDPRFPWVSIRPQGNKIVGIYMIGGGAFDALFADIGLISVQE